MIPERLVPSLQGVFPSAMVTVNEDGTPNIGIISQAYYVDDAHIAISNQFFSKTFQNLTGNRQAFVQVYDPADFSMWVMDLVLERIETSGELFDQMSMQLEVIASYSGMQDVFSLKSAYVFRVLTVKHLI